MSLFSEIFLSGITVGDEWKLKSNVFWVDKDSVIFDGHFQLFEADE